MKKPSMDTVLHVVGVVVALGGLIDAIFAKDENKELKNQVTDLQKRINNLENNGRS